MPPILPQYLHRQAHGLIDAITPNARRNARRYRLQYEQYCLRPIRFLVGIGTLARRFFSPYYGFLKYREESRCRYLRRSKFVAHDRACLANSHFLHCLLALTLAPPFQWLVVWFAPKRLNECCLPKVLTFLLLKGLLIFKSIDI